MLIIRIRSLPICNIISFLMSTYFMKKYVLQWVRRQRRSHRRNICCRWLTEFDLPKKIINVMVVLCWYETKMQPTVVQRLGKLYSHSRYKTISKTTILETHISVRLRFLSLWRHIHFQKKRTIMMMKRMIGNIMLTNILASIYFFSCIL